MTPPLSATPLELKRRSVIGCFGGIGGDLL
jgi:hypothetical protein